MPSVKIPDNYKFENIHTTIYGAFPSLNLPWAKYNFTLRDSEIRISETNYSTTSYKIYYSNPNLMLGLDSNYVFYDFGVTRVIPLEVYENSFLREFILPILPCKQIYNLKNKEYLLLVSNPCTGLNSLFETRPIPDSDKLSKFNKYLSNNYFSSTFSSVKYLNLSIGDNYQKTKFKKSITLNLNSTFLNSNHSDSIYNYISKESFNEPHFYLVNQTYVGPGYEITIKDRPGNKFFCVERLDFLNYLSLYGFEDYLDRIPENIDYLYLYNSFFCQILSGYEDGVLPCPLTRPIDFNFWCHSDYLQRKSDWGQLESKLGIIR